MLKLLAHSSFKSLKASISSTKVHSVLACSSLGVAITTTATVKAIIHKIIAQSLIMFLVILICKE
jgi:hypothetical protein